MNGLRVLAGMMVLAAAGCASNDSTRSGRWSVRARDIAQRRLAAAPQADPQDVAVGHRAEADRGAAVVVPLPRTRLAAETPAETTPAQPETREAGAEPAAVERGPLPGFGETVQRDLKEFPGLLWSDTKRVYTDPLNLVFLIGAGGASLALRPEVDDDIEDYYDRRHSLKEDWRDAFGVTGNPVTHFAMAGAWYLVGQQAQDAKTYEVGKRMVSVLTITGVSTMLLKVAANTESPNGEELAWPSGHVASTMAMATVLNDAYGPLVGVPMFGLTGLVGLERLDSGEHHFSDLVFGAALGWVVAETIMNEHRPEVFGGELVPYMDPAGRNAGVAWIKTLGN